MTRHEDDADADEKFARLEDLTRQLLAVSKEDLERARQEPDSHPDD